MPRPLSSARYISSSASSVDAEEDWLRDEEFSKIETVDHIPDYLSITWLASKLTVYGQKHMSASGLKGTFYVGQGATFIVYRTRKSSNGKSYAIKRPIISFGRDKDETQTFRQLYSLQLELRVLTDRRIRSHGNIAKLETVFWEEHSDDLGRYWPSLVMEYAESGTLSNLYGLGWRPLNFEQEQRMCHGIGAALKFLHENGVIHGDVKPDNVLMFAGSSSKNAVTPKLADFGYSLLDDNSASFLPLGTFPWTAPEIGRQRPSRAQLLQADVYSFGLLVWFVTRDGHNPFESPEVCPYSLDSSEAESIIRNLKESDSLLDLAVKSVPRAKSIFIDFFKQTLQRKPEARELKEALEWIKSDPSEDQGIHTITEKSVPYLVKERDFEVRELRHTGSRVQPQILQSLEARTRAEICKNTVQRSEAAMAMAVSCLERICGKKPEEALDWLLLAASLGHANAMASAYRVAKALGLYETKREQILTCLTNSAREGIPTSVEDLIEADPIKGKEIVKILKAVREAECFPSFGTCADRAEILDRGIAQLSLGNVELIDINLHGAARCGNVPLIQAIIRRCRHESGFLDKENDLCQTPLLLACISGETSAALALLAAGAKATKPDHKGDTPLHWLHVLEPKDIPTLGLALLEGGAEINAISMRFEMDDLQRKPLCAGTPLHRAAAWNSLEVSKFLLEHGADPLRPGVSNKLGTPLWLACTYHNYDVVRLILEYISKSDHVASIINDDETGDWPLLKPTLDIGYYYLNGGVLGRMMRHGENYQLAAETTFKVLKSNGATMKLKVVPALSQAIMLRSDDMVQVLLDLSPEMINTPGGPYQQPPLHFAVEQDRPDLVELVMSRGADTTSLDGHGLTALEHYCNHHRGLDIPRLLLKKGLTFKLTSSGLPTPFFGAIRNGAFELARFILQNTPKEIRHLMINSPCCKSRNFEYQPPGLTILGYLILDCGTDTPRTLSKLFKLVAEFDENVEFIVEPGEDRTALQGLVIFHPPKNLSPITAALCRELMKRSDSREQINHMSKPDRRTALWFAVNLMNPDLVAELLWRGADARLTDSNGVSAVNLLEKLLIHLQKSESHRDKGEERLVKEMERLFKCHGYL